MTTVIDGDAVADGVRGALAGCVETLADAAVTPGLATVLVGDDPASETYVSLKQRDCEEMGMNGIHVDIDAEAPPEELYDTLEALNDDPAVHGYLVQDPVPEHVDYREVLRRISPEKDVDGFHPENVGRLVAGEPRYKPCTPHGIQKLLAAHDIDTEGADVVIVGRSSIVGKPLANLLLRNDEGGNATVTVCHSRTRDLAEKTRRADVLVVAAGVPELVDGSMIAEGATVIDVGINRVARSGNDRQESDGETTGEYELVGDVEFESARERAGAITPVPGGVGPMTRAMLLYNTVKAASEIEDVTVALP